MQDVQVKQALKTVQDFLKMVDNGDPKAVRAFNHLKGLVEDKLLEAHPEETGELAKEFRKQATMRIMFEWLTNQAINIIDRGDNGNGKNKQ
jgi:hypothetical protein